MTDQQKWQIVLDHDARFAGDFVYAVSSTRVFCRPTCSAKRPALQNVTFFDCAKDAINAGFRACKRCRPDEPFQLSLEDASGVSARDLAEATRMGHLKRELQSGQNVLNASLEAGFGSTRALYERAPSSLGMTPATYAKGGANTLVRFAIRGCELGFVLVARTAVGVCSVALNDDAEKLEMQLRDEFFAATIERDDEQLQPELETILDSLNGKTAFPDLTLDVRATAFQARVWRELQRLERGEVVSYSDLAERIGEPKAVRAVASACARNPVALVHPCHRVVGKDGAARGFRWCIERKKKLLEREKK